MIKFFRKIRYDLMEKNKTGKYLKYAIGEIVLVVIGILIALSINNWNEQTKIEAKIDAIFKNVLEELSKNIDNSNNLIKFYQTKDTIFNLVLNDKLTYNDYANPKIEGIFNTITLYGTVTLNRNAYDNLVLNMDEISIKYNDIVSELNVLHTVNKNIVDDFSELIKNMVNNNLLEQSEKFEWYSFQGPPNKNEGFINYMLTNYTYKNKVKDFQTSGIGNHLRHTLKYREKAVNIYQNLATLIDEPTVDDSFLLDSDLVKNWLGDWETEQFPDEVVAFYVEENQLYIKFNTNSNEETNLYLLSKNKAVDVNGNYLSLTKENEEYVFKVAGMEYRKVKK